MANGLNPDVAEDDYSISKWGVAWWDRRTLEWKLLSPTYFTREEAEGTLADEQQVFPNLPHRLVAISETFSYHEVDN